MIAYSMSTQILTRVTQVSLIPKGSFADLNRDNMYCAFVNYEPLLLLFLSTTILSACLP